MNTANDLPEGTVLGGRYRLGPVIGRGGMAVVYRAEDDLLTRQVAVKVIAGASATEDALQRQFSEAQIGAKLNHSGLVAVYDVQPNATPPFIVMELVEGMTLSDALKRGQLRPAAVAEIGSQLCAALSAVHDAGIVHRDIKPSNVMLVSDDEHTVKLTDFGISLLVDATRITAAGSLVGTARYLSPEQVLGERVDRPTDIYALGLVLVECLTGESVFPGTQTETMSARLHRPPTMPTNVGDDWIRVLTAMTAREATARPDARTCSDALRALAEGRSPGPLGVADDNATQVVAAPAAAAEGDQTRELTTPAPAPTAAAPPTPPSDRDEGTGSRRRWAILAAIAVIAVLIIGGMVWAMPGGDDSGDEEPDDSPTTGQNDRTNSPGENNEQTDEPEPTSEPTTDEPEPTTDEPTTTDQPTSEPTETATEEPTQPPTQEPTTEPGPTSEPSETQQPAPDPAASTE
ncbi:MAG TPA: protein kinase [Nocardioidaceae bacterium]|nr:protein kinase [Nocardioidaceae bacterium]